MSFYKCFEIDGSIQVLSIKKKHLIKKKMKRRVVAVALDNGERGGELKNFGGERIYVFLADVTVLKTLYFMTKGFYLQL